MRNKKGITIQNLIDSGAYTEIIQLRYKKVKITKIAEIYKVSEATIYKLLKQITKEASQQIDNINNINTIIVENKQDKEEKVDIQEFLYDNRKKLIQMRRDGQTMVEIANNFGVTDFDINEFLKKRTKFSTAEIRTIKQKSESGESDEELATLFNCNIKTIQNIVGRVIYKPSTPETEVSIIDSANIDLIKKFGQFINDLQFKQKMSQADLDKQNSEIQDFLHQIEFNDYENDECLEIVNKIKELRMERRENKLFIELIQPLADFMVDEANARTIRTFLNILGRINNKAKEMGNRIYCKKGEIK